MGQVILFLIAILLCVILFPMGFMIAIFYSDAIKYIHDVCIGLDQLGNVVCAKLFNMTLTKTNHFGNPDETISSAIGRAKLSNQLTWTGKALDWFLNLFDYNHSIKSIEDGTR
jgi:hypothetical protein